MKRTFSLLSVLTFVLALSGSVFAQPSQAITATANVQAQINITKNNDIDFATIQQGSSPTIDPSGSNSDVGAGAKAGDLDITASSSTQLVISWTASPVLSDGSGNTMPYSPAVYADTTGGSTTQITGNGSAASNTSTDTSGSLHLSVGGNLTVGASQTSGSYSTANTGGTPFSITVNYQ